MSCERHSVPKFATMREWLAVLFHGGKRTGEFRRIEGRLPVHHGGTSAGDVDVVLNDVLNFSCSAQEMFSF